MSKCCNCQYSGIGAYNIKDEHVTITCCTLTNHLMQAEADIKCNIFNKDLSSYDICYNCKYYRGGGDWGLFCSHKDMYHHLGRFNDKPCKYYDKK